MLRQRGELAPALLVAAVALAVYAPLLRRGFTSEDFLLIRYLGEHPPWQDLAAQLSSPWLGLSGIRFLRPLSTTFFAVEIALFGAGAVGYNCVHVALHAVNAMLVLALARELLSGSVAGRRAGTAAGVLFAIHPLHPNAVIFAASFATLWGATFFLAAVVAYLRYARTERPRWWAASFGAFACALLCYEAAAILPLWLAAAAHLAPVSPRRHRERVLTWLPFAALLAAYLAWRRWVFGVVIGGYDATRERLLGGDLVAVAGSAATSIQRLFLPLFDPPLGPLTAAAVVCMLFLPPAGWLMWRRHGGDGRRWCTAWIWAVSALAPFGFEPMVPANGRYGYLAAAGAVLVLASLAAAAAGEGKGTLGRSTPWLALLAVALLWCGPLVSHLRACAAAARTAHEIQQALLAREQAVAGRPWFVTRYPYFVDTGAGDPAAQVFHYGLRDAVHPPFSRRAADVLPLPPLSGVELIPLWRGAGSGRIWEWVPGRGLRSAAPVATRPLVELATVAAPTAGEAPPAALIRVPPGPHRRFRLLISAPINGAVFDVPPPAPGATLLRVEMPLDFLRTNAHLYGAGRWYWWLEARDEAGALTGYTPLRSLPADVLGSAATVPPAG